MAPRETSDWRAARRSHLVGYRAATGGEKGRFRTRRGVGQRTREARARASSSSSTSTRRASA